jgi:hypothetical protein
MEGKHLPITTTKKGKGRLRKRKKKENKIENFCFKIKKFITQQNKKTGHWRSRNIFFPFQRFWSLMP